MKIKQAIFAMIFLGMPGGGLIAAGQQYLQFHVSAKLVESPCNLSAGSEVISVDLGDSIVKGLYRESGGAKIPFNIVLTDCNPEIMNQLTMKLEGVRDDELPSALAIDPSSEAQGIAINFSMQAPSGDDIPLPLGESSRLIDMSPVEPGDDYPITVQAHVVGKPNAIESKGIVAGKFSATATYSLEYY